MLNLKKIPVSKSTNDNSVESPMDSTAYAPSLHFNEKQVSEVKDWQVGEDYTLMIEVTMTSKNENEKGGVSAYFDILSYKEVNDKEMIDNMSQADLEKMQAEGLKNK